MWSANQHWEAISVFAPWWEKYFILFVVFCFYFISALQGDDDSNYRVYVLGYKSQVLTWLTITTWMHVIFIMFPTLAHKKLANHEPDGGVGPTFQAGLLRLETHKKCCCFYEIFGVSSQELDEKNIVFIAIIKVCLRVNCHMTHDSQWYNR